MPANQPLRQSNLLGALEANKFPAEMEGEGEMPRELEEEISQQKLLTDMYYEKMMDTGGNE